MNKSDFAMPGIETESIETLSLKLLHAMAELTEKNNQLLKMKKDREVMMGNISHDLRAPITAIRSSLDYLMSCDDISKEELQNTLKIMDRRTNTLSDMIQDMYYLFCVEDEDRPLEMKTVDACMILEEYFYDAECDARYANHNLVLDVPENLNCQVTLDLQKAVRVLDNLFNNAAKYTPPGCTITLSARELQTQTVDKNDKIISIEKYLEIQVKDDGPGIPAESVSHIFDRTYTVSSARTPDGSTGSGLGLAIVKAIVEKHGGRIKCRSDVGMGCQFVIRLPI